ncbi:unnamed protein product [Rhizophagus irregularis]|nr:unnamed protein product [Rhizophagus irregularis]
MSLLPLFNNTQPTLSSPNRFFLNKNLKSHAIYLGGSNNHEIGNDEENEENWILEDYQKGNGQVKAFINHVKKGIELVKENDESLLIFSGGQTRPSAGPRSEAQSYYILAQSLNLNLSSTINSTTSLNTRIITEEYARDSYENLLFSICRFNEYTNSYPRNITVIGFQFKKKRFSELHRFALKFPLDRFNYIGIDPDNTSPLGRFVGQTRPSAGPRSEAQSYYILAQSLNLNLSSTINSTTSLNTRIITEEYARDSYENLLFSICRFNEYTNSYPRNITVIGFQFKKKRFSELHRFALKFPLDRFNYIGIDPDNTSPLGRFVGESVNSLGPFKQDLYGCHGKLLDKKLTRNPYRRSHPYQISCPELSPLLNYCPEDRIQLYPDKLPWEY